jgi:hypothetical protein
VPFLLAHARNKVGEAVLKGGIDDVVRIYSDNITFNRDVDLDIPNLLPEGKTSGNIEWTSARFGKHICAKCDARFRYAKKEFGKHIEEC